MPKSKVHVEVGKRTLELSNLDKVLYPADGIVKAEVIEYYLLLAPTILRHMRERALSLVRYPDGIDGEQFFQKHRPSWAPDWIPYKRLGQERTKEYVVAHEEATFVWLANLACLELHQIHSFSPNSDTPDYIVYDLDPPEGGFELEELKSIAVKLKEHLEQHGYHVFVKTTGGKGLHLVTPIEALYSFEDVFQCAKTLATSFVKAQDNTTLHLKKEARKGRVLIDIYRNRPSQTIIGAYSLRGKEGATASTPLSWAELQSTYSLSQWNIKTTKEKVLDEGDVWEGMRGWSVPLHTDRRRHGATKPHNQGGTEKMERLAAYEEKRDFEKTPEPGAEGGALHAGSRFVVQRHHASHLHYDLRLEEDGVLKSWAIPRGLPPVPGVKRLAVATEDHPLNYLTFEGEIPKGEYGGGTMWIFASGKYEITKKKKEGFYVRLAGKQLNAEYRMHRMKGKEWLLERVDVPQRNWLIEPLKPMLASAAASLSVCGSGNDYTYELKWDGIRALIYINEGEMKVYSRNLNDITDQFPELNVPQKAFRVNNAIFDAEIVCLDADGRANFKKVMKRLLSKKMSETAARRSPAYAYVFDCLYLDGRTLINDSQERRRVWMEDAIKAGETNVRICEAIDDGKALFEAAKLHELEGIVAKKKKASYAMGKRSEAWLKVKVRATKDCVIVGFVLAEGERSSAFASLQIAEHTSGKLMYRGRVGTGFDEMQMKEISRLLKPLITEQKNIHGDVNEERKTVWVQPVLQCEVEFSQVTDKGSLRDAVFKKMLDDLFEP